jgi:hypothetical protein
MLHTSRRRRHNEPIYRPVSGPVSGLVLVAAVVLGLFFVSPIGPLLQAHAAGSEPLLPNLVADPPDNVSFETSQTDGGLSGEKVTPELLLRFNGYVHNVGPGALDFRGERNAPKVSKATEEEVERHREKEEGLPQKTEEELASPPMNVSQRLFTTKVGEEETNIERAHLEAASAAEMFYVNADGHHHWHLQRVAKYSLWNAAKTAEVAPAQKVGFCLEDSEHVEPSVGPSKSVYADNVAPFRDFCQQYRPNATGVYEGISPGWRDRYTSDLGFQWVDASNVLPGEYWLREDVNPTGVIKEVAGENTPSYATSPTIVPGFDAQAQATGTEPSEPITITLTSKTWNDLATPKYTIVSAPQHGTLVAGNHNNQEIYTPQAGYQGADTFTFAAADPNSEFPRGPAVATVAIQVGSGETPTVAVEGPSSMIAGTSAQFSALVSNDNSEVTWSVGAGSITSGGLYIAPAEPPVGGTVTVIARSAKGAQGERTIVILPVPPPVAAPAASLPPERAPPSRPSGVGSTLGSSASSPPGVSRPQAMLIGRKLIMTTRVSEAGRVRLSAYLGKRRLGTCVTQSPANRTFTCRLTLGRGVSIDAQISVWASLRVGRLVQRQLRPAARVQEMKMAGGPGQIAGAPGLIVHGRELSWQLLCSPELAPA